MTVKTYKVIAALLIALTIAFSAETASAQSTIFNIPTTDTVSKGKVYAEFDFLAQAPAPDTGEYKIFNPRLIVGASNTVEVGVNFPVYRSGGVNSGYIQPNAKVKFYNNDDGGVAVAAGALFNTPLNNREAQESWGLVYTEFSKKVKSGNYGPRFHIGPFGAIAQQEKAGFLGTRAGVILGYEQPIHPKASIVADWFSGKNSIGYFTPGISIVLPGSGLLNVGYSVGNDSWENSNATKNRYFFAYYGVTF